VVAIKVLQQLSKLSDQLSLAETYQPHNLLKREQCKQLQNLAGLVKEQKTLDLQESGYYFHPNDPNRSNDLEILSNVLFQFALAVFELLTQFYESLQLFCEFAGMQLGYQELL
jgi:hypothetical protein